MTEQEIIEKLKTMISEKRLEHSLNVRDVSVRLAEHYGADAKKARIAGILHDCAKNIDCKQSTEFAKDHKIELDEITLKHHLLLHAPIGAKVAEVEFGISDEEVLNAIKYHTTGHENMSLLEKIVCLADYIEPTRKFDGIDKIREMAFNDIDSALVASFGTTINFVISKNYLLHPTTVLARNSLLERAAYKE